MYDTRLFLWFKVRKRKVRENEVDRSIGNPAGGISGRLIYHDGRNSRIGKIKPWGIAGKLDPIYDYLCIWYGDGKRNYPVSCCAGFAADPVITEEYHRQVLKIKSVFGIMDWNRKERRHSYGSRKKTER